MKIKRKTMLVFILVTVMICGLYACEQGDDRLNAEIQTEGEHEPITINQFNNLITEDFEDALHKVYPEINLEIVSYAGRNGSGYAQYSLENNDITDIYVTTQNFSKEIQPDRLIDLSSYAFVNNYSACILNALDMDGSIYLLPTGYTLAGVYYNKTIMKENGWQVPTNFEELLALIPEIEAAGYQPFANAMDLEGYPFNYFFSLGNTVYFGTQDGVRWKEDFPKGNASAAGNEGLQAVVDYYNEWIVNHLITNEHTSVEEYQEKGNIVFYLCLGLPSYKHETAEGKTYEFGIMPWLSRDGTNNMLTQNISRYFGISKRLQEKGNEQKLEDALHIIEFLSSEAGQKTVMSGYNMYVNPLSDNEIAEDSPYYEVADIVKSGHTVQMVYIGWEELIIPIAGDIRSWIKGETTADKFLERLDLTYEKVVNLGIGDFYGTVTETLTYEKTAELCAIAEGKAVNADCAMVSLNKYHGEDNVNSKGVAWYLWKGRVDSYRVNIIRPNSETISVLELTGAEIKAMQAAGFDFNENGNPYDYLLFTRGGIELDDSATYRLAISTGEVPEAYLEQAETVKISTEVAIKKYVGELGTFGPEDIVWTK